LVAHARARRIDPTLGGDAAYWNEHSTTKHVKSVRFRREGVLGGLSPVKLSGMGTPRWMATIPSTADVVAVRLEVTMTHVRMSDGSVCTFAGPSEGILISGPRHSQMWTAHWSSAEDRGQSTVLSVVYSADSVPNRSIDNPSIDLASELLDEALRDIRAFAAEQDLSSWRETFDAAREALRADHPTMPYHHDILPSHGYTLEARQLLAAAVTGYVFGGMGSWNDRMYYDEERALRFSILTESLRRAVESGVMVAVNRGDEASAH